MPDATPTIGYLTLWLTTACNLECVYCYRGPTPPQTMSHRTAMAAVDLAGDHGGALHVQLAGGEPTLEPGLIEAVARRAALRHGPTRVAVQTNATLLDPAMVAMFKRWRVAVGVSLDGPPEVQEAQRGQAEATMAGLRLLNQAGVDFNITAVVTAHSVEHLPRLALMLAGLEHAQGLGLDLLVSRGRATDGQTPMATPQALALAAAQLANHAPWINARRARPFVLRELARLGQRQANFCHAQAGRALATHPSGHLFPCGQTMNDPELALGHIDAPHWQGNGVLAGHRLEGPHCAGCLLAGQCPGECPSRLRYNGREGRRQTCAMLRAMAQALAANGEKAHATT